MSEVDTTRSAPRLPYREMEESHELSHITHPDHDELLTLNIGPHHPATHGVLRLLTTLEHLRARGFGFLASVHGVDYFPEEPRLGVHYELLDMREVDRISVRTRVPVDNPHVPSVTLEWPTADHQEREIFDMFGVIFDGHHDLRRILMPEDYEGHPQRRDFPIGGEPVLFTHDERTTPDWWS